MNSLQLLSALMPLMLALVAAVERIFTKRGSGAEKKLAVGKGLVDMSKGLLQGTPADKAQTLGELVPLLDASIDTAAAVLFPQTHDGPK